MRATTTTLLLATASLATAFSNTYPILAFSSSPLEALSSLSPSRPPPAAAVFSPSSPQQPFPAEVQADDDLCSLSTVLLVSAPGLHYSDLALLPSTPTGVRAALEHASKQGATAASHPYVPLRNGFISPAEKLAKKFVKECSATVEKVNEKSLWAGSEGKTVRVEVVEGLDEWELTGANARQQRTEIMANLDSIVEGQLRTLSAPYLVILTSLGSDSTSSLLPVTATKKHAKRQYDEDYAYLDNGDEISEDWAGETMAGSETVTVYAPSNATSIFSPKANSGLLHRYVFFTPSLVFALLISFLILIPVVVMSSQALTTVGTVAGLESKMTGTVGIDASKK